MAARVEMKLDLRRLSSVIVRELKLSLNDSVKNHVLVRVKQEIPQSGIPHGAPGPLIDDLDVRVVSDTPSLYQLHLVSPTEYAPHVHFPGITRRWAGDPYLTRSHDIEKRGVLIRAGNAVRGAASRP